MNKSINNINMSLFILSQRLSTNNTEFDKNIITNIFLLSEPFKQAKAPNIQNNIIRAVVHTNNS